MEILNSIVWLVIGVILAIFIPIIKQFLRNKVQRNRIKFFVSREKGLDSLFLGVRDKTGFIHTIVCEVDFESFGISQKETESLDKSLKEGESKRVYLDVE